MAAEWKFRSVFAIALVLLCVVAGMSYYSIVRLQFDAAWVAHTQRVLTSLESFFSAVTDAIAAQRGYVTTGGPAFLEVHDRGMAEAHSDLRMLRELTADSPAQQGRMEGLAALLAEREAFSRRAIELRRDGEVEAARSFVGSGKGIEIHERIRRLVDEAEDGEKTLLGQRELLAAQAAQIAKLIIAAGALLGILTTAAALIFVARDFTGRRASDRALRAVVDELEIQVGDRIGDVADAVALLRDSEARLGGIIHSAMDAIITIDEDQKVVVFNEAAENIFRCPNEKAIGASIDRFIPERFRAAHRGYIEHFGVTGATSRRMGERMTLAGLRDDGGEFPIDASISQVTMEGKKFYTVILRDITEHKQAEQALNEAYHQRRSASERLHGIIQSAMDGVITMDSRQRIVLFNDAAEKIFRCREREAIGSPLERFIPERFRAAHRGHVEKFGETRVTTRMMGGRLELFGLRADGEEFPIDASISQVTVDGERFYTVILRDITERKAAEAALRRSHDELRELSGAMHDVREAERTRIARELHDELAQWLTAIKMDISWLSSRLPPGQPQLRDKTEKVKGLVDTTVNAVRRIAADLRPVMLDDLGLVPAIESLLHDLSQRSNIIISFDVESADLDFHEPLATALYRMTQEALTNVARHSGATEVRVTIARVDEDLVLQVRDNGTGFDPVAAARKKSYGVLGIQERAYTLGGKARIARAGGGGTVVEITIPVARYRRGVQDT